MKIIAFFLLTCIVLFATGCPVSKSTPKIPKSVKAIVDESDVRGTSDDGNITGGKTNRKKLSFEAELNLLMEQYDCITGIIAEPAAPVDTTGKPIVVTTKTTRKVTSNINANTAANTNANTNSNTSSNSESSTFKNTTSTINSTGSTRRRTSNATENINENSNSNTNSNTNSETSSTTVSNTTAETVEEITTTSDTTVTTVTIQCGGVVIQDRNKAAKQLRDSIIQRMLRVIDYAYFQFENDLYVKRATGSFLADFVDIGANLAATITNGERAKTIINAAIIAFRGNRKSASIHYFQEQTADVLITKMQTSRNRVLADMLRQMKDDVDTYSLDAGLRDVINYFYAGTLPRALQDLKKDTSIDAQQAENEVRRIKNIKSSPLVTEVEGNFADCSMDILVELDTQVTQTNDPELAKKAAEKVQKLVVKLSENEEIKKILTDKNVSSTDNPSDLLNDKLVPIRSDLRTFQNFDLLNKINQIICEVGNEK